MTLTRDLAADLDEVQSIAPQALTDGTVNGTSADMQGFESGAALLDVGLYTDGTHTATVQDSADDVTFAALAAADVSSVSGPNTVHPIVVDSATNEDNVTYLVGFAATVERYVRWSIVTASSTTGAVIGALIVRGHARHL